VQKLRGGEGRKGARTNLLRRVIHSWSSTHTLGERELPPTRASRCSPQHWFSDPAATVGFDSDVKEAKLAKAI
jgi:hypothetical protein